MKILIFNDKVITCIMTTLVSNNNILRILSFDPGFSVLGWSLCEYNKSTDQLYFSKYGDFRTLKQIKKQKDLIDKFDSNILATIYLEQEIKKLISFVKPHFTVTEDVFINYLRPQAYAPLFLCVHIISRILFQYFEQPLYKLPPKTIKMIMTGSGNSDKDSVHDSILNNPSITIKENKQIPLLRLLSHHTDAMAAGYTFIRVILPTLTVEQVQEGYMQYNKKEESSETTSTD
jgi:Holliday junction resolvasome RuvABC endonuclease subunit